MSTTNLIIYHKLQRMAMNLLSTFLIVDDRVIKMKLKNPNNDCIGKFNNFPFLWSLSLGFIHCVFICLLIINCSFANAKSIGPSTGYELPRYVSLKSNKSNLRVGASKDYPKILTYVIENLPIEITDEYKQWREVKDIDGNHGWMHKSLFQGDRFGIIKTNYIEPAKIFNKPRGAVIGKIGNRNIVKIDKCLKSWCHISFDKANGWVNKINIWGAYKEEEFNVPFFQFIINLYWRLI